MANKQNPIWYKEYYAKNRAKKLAAAAVRYASNPEPFKEARKAAYSADPEKFRAIARDSYDSVKACRYSLEYRKAHPGCHSKWRNRRYHSDPEFKIRVILRSRLRLAIKEEKGFKGGSAVKLLGCELPFLKSYIESLWMQGMSWENHGLGVDRWNFDHIKPLSRFDLLDPLQLAEACHYSNLQPLWTIDNIKKGNR